MAAPPLKDPSRLGKGPSSRPNPPGTGSFAVTPSTYPKPVWTPSPVVAGSVRSGNKSALTASAEVTQASGRSLQHPRLGDSHLSNRSPAVASVAPVSAVVPDRDGQRPYLRADPVRLHAGNTQTLPVEQSLDSRHFTLVYQILSRSGAFIV